MTLSTRGGELRAPFAAADTRWHTAQVALPDGSGGVKFSSPGVPWDGAASAISFSPVDDGREPGFDLCIDDLTFAPAWPGVVEGLP